MKNEITLNIVINKMTDKIKEERITADRTLINIARILSFIFTPFFIPMLAFIILFLFSYLHMLPLGYKLIVTGIVYCFTILIPTLTIHIFRKVNGFKLVELNERKKRYVPFLLTILSYICCLLMMRKMSIPWYMTGIILTALMISRMPSSA